MNITQRAVINFPLVLKSVQVLFDITTRTLNKTHPARGIHVTAIDVAKQPILVENLENMKKFGKLIRLGNNNFIQCVSL